MNAIERVIKKWRSDAKKMWNNGDNGEACGTTDCAEELERLYHEVIEPIVAALKDAIDYPGDVLVRGRTEAALAKLEGREDATNATGPK